MSAQIIVAAAAFLLSLGLAQWLAKARRERLAFAALVAAPLVAAVAFAAVAAFESGAPGGAASTPAAATARASSPSSAAAVAAADADALRRQAEDLYHAKNYTDARDAYARLVKALPGDVDAWADLADAAAAAAGGDLKAGTEAIDRALAIDPNHPKALWLKASLELQEKRYRNSAQVWERLLTLLPPASSDAQIVRANLEEARTLAKSQAAGR